MRLAKPVGRSQVYGTRLSIRSRGSITVPTSKSLRPEKLEEAFLFLARKDRRERLHDRMGDEVLIGRILHEKLLLTVNDNAAFKQDRGHLR